jgi:hypothetical protein
MSMAAGSPVLAIVQVTSTALILHEVSGLGLGRQAIPDEVTMRRLGTM